MLLTYNFQKLILIWVVWVKNDVDKATTWWFHVFHQPPAFIFDTPVLTTAVILKTLSCAEIYIIGNGNDLPTRIPSCPDEKHKFNIL